RIDRIEALVREIERVEVGDDHASAPAEPGKFSLADLPLHGGIGHAGDLDLAAAGEVVGRRARAAPELEKSFAVLRPEQGVFGRVELRKRGAWKDAGAVIGLLLAIGAEHVVVGAVLVIVLVQVVRTRRPLDQLALLEFIQLMADSAGVLQMRDKKKEYVVKKI